MGRFSDLRHVLIVFDWASFEGLMPRKTVVLRCTYDSDDRMDIRSDGELDGERSEGGGRAVNDQRSWGEGRGWVCPRCRQTLDPE